MLGAHKLPSCDRLCLLQVVRDKAVDSRIQGVRYRPQLQRWEVPTLHAGSTLVNQQPPQPPPTTEDDWLT